MYKRIIILIIFIVVIVFISFPIKSYDLSESENIKVEVKGNVENEGVFELPIGSTINDLLQLVNIKSDSDISKISKLTVLRNNQVIVIEKIKEEKLISINNAEIAELTTLPGIGTVIASRIIEYRNNYGSFNKIDDLKNVNGIGDKIFERIKQYICL